MFYSRTTRDWLGLLYTNDESPPFTVCWSEDVLADVIHHLRKNHPDWDGAKTSRVHDLIAGTFEVGRVTDYTVDGTYRGGDGDDAHVHAAAVSCRADILLTCNTKDFTPDGEDFGYEVITPDEFFVLVDETAPALVRSVTAAQRDYWLARNGQADLCASLRAAACPRFAERVLHYLHELADIHIAAD